MESTQKKIVKISSRISVKRLSEVLNLSVSVVIGELMKNGILATINEQIDFETASIIAQYLGFEVEEEVLDKGEAMTLEKLLEILKKEKETGENLQARPPVVTILGHVDHGKTTLLDNIRKTNIVAKESGGITQHINAYQVKKKGKSITFIDTPGHEAFSAMRERGVSLADIAILVVAADDGVRPQTKEVIEYLLEKKIPTIVAINKIDKAEANIQKVKEELGKNGILVEEWGGQILCSEVSAKNNLGMDELLENILLLMEVEDFKADYKREALGIILESHLDPKKGAVATVLIKTGILKEGQDIAVGSIFGRVRRLEDFLGKRLKEAGPSTPVSLFGLSATCQTNDVLQAVSSRTIAKTKSDQSSGSAKGLMENGQNSGSQKSYKRIIDENIKRLPVILKADVQGSIEAIEQILSEIKSEEVAIDYIYLGIGNATESDMRLAQASGAILLGFNVEITPVAKRMAEAGEVEVKNYKVIYELIEEIKKRLSSMLPPLSERTDFGKLKVLAIFKNGKKDMIVGGKVISGKMINKTQVEVLRNENIIGRGQLSNLQQNKVDTNEVEENQECGITFLGETKIKEGDVLISYKEEIKPGKL
ncbi:MAG: translation initiation factor IF-2 [Candidatus Moranbacteria bacterium CG23_combo_of_CG06-09_8_20_14_all_40_16]|nr:MAG: translation initiation factor IF-2 [Candidatus Moranbacteria bacterium CG23_combo_of_CG06-09_8_20_14_all_40_16]